MKCPNCSSQMYVTDQNATDKSRVKFYRCSNCIGAHVSSEPVSSIDLQQDEAHSLTTSWHRSGKQIQMV